MFTKTSTYFKKNTQQNTVSKIFTRKWYFVSIHLKFEYITRKNLHEIHIGHLPYNPMQCV